MKISLVQCNPTVGAIGQNAKLVEEYIRKAKSKGARIIIFPELVLTGYPPQDLLLDKRFISQNIESAKRIAKKTGSETVIFGFAHREGNKIYNAAACASKGRIERIVKKSLLPNYDVFDEKRYFTEGVETEPINIGGRLVGVHICEDLWDEGTKIKTCDILAKKGAEFFINISASPYCVDKLKQREKLARAKARKFKKPFVYVNLAGGQDEIVFDGRSFVLNSKGDLCAVGKQFHEDIITVNIDRLRPLKQKPTILHQEVYEALVLGLRDYVRKNGFKEVVIGISGGIDSALVACIAADALGAQNVIGVVMPSRFTSRESVEHARALAKKLKIRAYTISIEDIVELNRRKWRSAFGPFRARITDENIQARERGKILMAIANDRNALVLSTGNKTELAMGYCTLYGDMSGGLSVISDIDKLSVYALAKWRNKKGAVIPKEIFTKPPTAELAEGQKDEDTLPPYNILSPIVDAYIEDGKSLYEIVRMGYPEKIVRSVLNRIHAYEYKRRQAPPGIKITKKAFGIGRRFPITSGYKF